MRSHIGGWTTAGALLLSLVACHTETIITPPVRTTSPFGTGAAIRLTYNPDQDYWPAWTQDGRGILYSFVNQENTAHRCLGILPAGGGTRIWQLCDNRAVRVDSVSSYSAYALDSTGRLLLVEAVSSTGIAASFPFHIRLQLTDTASPYVRTTLLTLPVTVGGIAVTWLSDMTWTGPNSFVALGQQFGSVTVPDTGAAGCGRFPCTDSTFANNGIVVRGTITGSTAALEPVIGTDSALTYSVVDNGTSIIFMRIGDARLFKARLEVGTGDAVATVATSNSTTGRGLACSGLWCVVASGFQLTAVSLGDGSTHLLATTPDLVATPIVWPPSGDVVAQVGGAPGHVASGGLSSNLYLYKNLLPQ